MKTIKTPIIISLCCAAAFIFGACDTLDIAPPGSEIPVDIKASPTPTEPIELFPTSIPVVPEEQATQTSETETPTQQATITFYQPTSEQWQLFLGSYELAEASYQATVTNNQSTLEEIAEAYLGLGKLAMLSGENGKAIDYLDYVIEQFPTTTAAGTSYYFLGEIYTSLGEPERAVRAYHLYQQAHPGMLDAFIWEKIGDSYLDDAVYQEAVNAFQTALPYTTADESINQLKKKIAISYAGLQENDLAIQYYLDAYLNSENGYLKAEINLRLSWLYFDMEFPEKAYERLQINISEFPYAYDSYTGLVTLVDDGQIVNEYQRGLTDYYAGKYGVAIDAFNRYIQQTPLSTRNGDVHHFNALAYLALEQYDQAILEWQQLITDFESSNYWTDSTDEIAYTQWAYLDNPKLAAQTYLDFVETYYFMDEAPIFLYRAARMYERANEFNLAAETWTQVAREYPAYELAFRAQQLAGVSYYRAENWEAAQDSFEDLLQYAATPEESAAAYFWLAKTYQKLQSPAEENSAWESAIRQAPGTYYSIRAEEIIEEAQPFQTSLTAPAIIDMDRERESAFTWMQSEFLLANDFDQINHTKLALNEKTNQAIAFWQLGHYSEAYDLLEELRIEYSEDAGMLFSLLDILLDLGAYRTAAFASRQIIDLAKADPVNLLTVPRYFNHIRYGSFYYELIINSAEKYDFSSVLVFSQIRQESLFDSHVGSSAGAIGLMQIISPTGQQIADQLLEPENYTTEDLYLPVVNIEYGTYYLDLQRDYFDGNLYLALAAYNAGPGNTGIWYEMANEDIDLFLEIIRFSETRNYLMNITETFQIYETLYQGISE